MLSVPVRPFKMCSLFFVLIHVLSAVVISHAKNITLNYSDPAIIYSSNWTVPQSSSDNSSFAISASVGASLSITVPAGTVSAEYAAFKRPGGSAYGVCLDCVGDQGAFQVIDGHEDDASTDGEATEPIVLFSTIDMDPSVPHTISVYNLPDKRFNKSGEITFNSVIFVTDDGNSNDSNDDSGDSSGSDETGDPESDSPDNSDDSDDSGATATKTTSSDSDDSDESSTRHHTLTAGRGSPSSTPVAAASSTDDSDPSTTTSAPQATSTDDADDSPDSDATTTSSTSVPRPSGSINNANTSSSNSDGSSTKSQPMSTALIAAVSILSVLTVISLVVGLFFYFRRRRRLQDASRLPDPEQDPNNNSRTPLRQPSSPTAVQGSTTLNMRQTDGPTGGVPPERPRNPFEGVSPATVPLDFNLELEYPGDSSLMKKRMRTRTGSSFGNMLGRGNM